jgi:hypothetical protein
VRSHRDETRSLRVVQGAVVLFVDGLPLQEITPVFILEALRDLARVADAAERGPRSSAALDAMPYHAAAQAQRHREGVLMLYIGAVVLLLLTGGMMVLPIIQGR